MKNGRNREKPGDPLDDAYHPLGRKPVGIPGGITSEISGLPVGLRMDLPNYHLPVPYYLSPVIYK